MTDVALGGGGGGQPYVLDRIVRMLRAGAGVARVRWMSSVLCLYCSTCTYYVTSTDGAKAIFKVTAYVVLTERRHKEL